MIRTWPAILLALLLLGCGDAEPPLHLYAAASLADFAEPLALEFEAQTGRPVHVSLGASGTLAQQLRQGAPGGVYLSADPVWMDRLDEWKLLQTGSRESLAANGLVVVVPADAAFVPGSLDDLTDERVHRIVLADPAVAPAGVHATTALAAAGVRDRLAPRLVFARDVRTALFYVVRGEADAGLVYATDAAGTADVRVAFPVAPELHEPVEYQLAVLRDAPASAVELHAFLRSERAEARLRELGFRVPE